MKQIENNKTLSEQEKSVMESILSIQDFYNLKDHHRLIQLILDEKQAKGVFGEKKVMISDVFDPQNKMDDATKISLFSAKYTYEALVEKFKRPKSFRNNMLVEILQKKLQKEPITSHQTRKQIWLLASGALFSMRSNKGLFEGLVSYQNYPKYYERAIQVDLNRTVKHHQCNSSQITSLRNVLFAFSRRNPYIGYCQGLNFIAFFLLTMQFTEQQAFWILSQITQTIIPMDYYTNMIGVACDQQIFLDVLRNLRPKIAKKFQEVGLDGSVLTIHWFVCLFTSALPFYLVKIVWDHLLVEGTKAFIKTGIVILSHFEKQIMQTSQFYEIIMLLEQGTKKLQIPEVDFNREFNKIYIHTQGLKIARDLYREFHIKQKLKEKTVENKGRKTDIQCSIEWPLCITQLDENRNNRQEVEIWTYRQQSSPKIIHDYLQNLSKYNKTTTTNSTINVPQSKPKISSQINIMNPSDFVIGRMQHICIDSKRKGIMTGKNLTKKKKDHKFLSMILEADDESQDRTVSNLKKILRMSATFDEMDDGQDYEGPRSQNSQTTEKEPNSFEKSETIQFFNKFMANNKQLAEMLVSKK